MKQYVQRYFVNVLLGGTLALFCSSVCATSMMVEVEQIVKAEIHYYGWDVLTRSRISVETIRRNPKITIVINDRSELRAFIRWLRVSEMKPVVVDSAGRVIQEDARLAIDFFYSDKRRITYYASRFRLLSEDSTMSRPVDDGFREMFTFVRPNDLKGSASQVGPRKAP